jgi:hypothetical protein
VARVHQTAGMPKHPIAVPVKQHAERLSVTVKTATPQDLLALHRREGDCVVYGRLHTA